MEIDPLQLARYIEKSTQVLCKSCGNQTFTEQVILRTVSKFIAMTEKDVLIPLPILACSKCGTYRDDMLPPILRKEQNPSAPENSGEIPTSNPVMTISKGGEDKNAI